MKAKTLIGLLLCVAAAMLCSASWALDEATLTPTPKSEVSMSQKDKAKADKEFNAAMSVWYKHDYPALRGIPSAGGTRQARRC